MNVFYCWDADVDGPDDARRVEADTDLDAAIKHVERIWNDGDHPLEMDVAVRESGDASEQYRVFHVEARQEWNFYGRPKDDGA